MLRPCWTSFASPLYDEPDFFEMRKMDLSDLKKLKIQSLGSIQILRSRWWQDLKLLGTHASVLPSSFWMFWVSKFSKCPTCFNMFMPIYTILGRWFSHLSLFNLLATSFLTHPTLRLGVWLCSHHLHLKESCMIWHKPEALQAVRLQNLPEILWYLHFLIKNDKCRSEVCIIGKDSQLKV